MYYEMRKHTGELPIIGVNTYLNPNPPSEDELNNIELARATEEEKEGQIANLRSFQKRNEAQTGIALERLKAAAVNGENIFAELMDCVKSASLGQITTALYEVGGQYRRNM